MEIIQQLTSSAWGVVAAVLVFGLCIFFHEAGHFIAAKLAGMRVDAFALGFGPKIFGWRRGDTEYKVCWVPLGGFVAIAGMEPGETNVERGFHSRPRWLGAIVIFAGVTMNIVLAILLYTLVTYTQGIPKPGATGTMVGGIYPRSPAATSGLRKGDQIVAVDGNRLGLLVDRVAPGSLAARLGIHPDDRIVQLGDQGVSAPTDLLADLRAAAAAPPRLVVADTDAENPSDAFHNIKLPPLENLDGPATSAAQAAKTLERTLGVTFAPMSQYDVVAYTNLRPNARLLLTVARKGQELTVPVTSYGLDQRVIRIDDQGHIETPYAKIGRIGLKLEAPTEPVALWKAAYIGGKASLEAVEEVGQSLWAMVSRKIEAAPGGPVSIFAMSYDVAQLGWAEVAAFAAFLSANLAVLNLFPFPLLDGFALVTLAYEGVRQRRVNARIEYVVKFAGLVLLLGLVVVLTFNDLRNLVLHGSP